MSAAKVIDSSLERSERIELKSVVEENREDLNVQLRAYEQICGIRIMEQEFEKTPKRSIKRFLYKDAEV